MGNGDHQIERIDHAHKIRDLVCQLNDAVDAAERDGLEVQFRSVTRMVETHRVAVSFPNQR